MTDKKLSPRDVFECEYIARHMKKDVYEDAKDSLERNRQDMTYSDEAIAHAFKCYISGVDWDLVDISKTETTTSSEEFWCKSCGARFGDGFHLGNCPTLKSKL
jgi:hypothetical protein